MASRRLGARLEKLVNFNYFGAVNTLAFKKWSMLAKHCIRHPGELNVIKKSVVVGVSAIALLGAGTTAASAHPVNTHGGTPSSTTLDACGYFVGTQTPQTTKTTTNSDGSTTTTEHGSWTGVSNNYVGTPVASLGPVQGRYAETVTHNVDGSETGTENFVSSAGSIDQVFAIGGGFDVSVTATKALSFLTSDTNGACYTGPFPRP
jgi:hypothetical protein